MRTFFKIIKIILLVIFIAVAALVAVAWSMEDRITKLAVEKVSDVVEAPLGMESASFSLIREFPLATIQFKGVWIGASKSSHDLAQPPSIDTLARFEKLYISVESKPLLDNIFNIREVEINGGFLKYLVDETGTMCFDFLLKSDTLSPAIGQDTITQAIDFTLDKLKLRDFTCHYQDDMLNTNARAHISELEGSAKIDSVNTAITARGGLMLTEFKFDQSNLYKMQEADLQFDLLYDSDTLFIDEMNIETDGASVDASGKLTFLENIKTDLSISASGLDLAKLSKFVPSESVDKYDVSQISGILNLKAKVDGMMSDSLMPHYDAKFDLTKGRIKWNDYPAMDDISISGSVNNGSLHNNVSTTINIDDLHMRSSGSSIDLRGTVYNLDKPHYDLKTRMNIDLEASRFFVPDTLVQNIRGKVMADIETKGILPDSIDNHFPDYLLRTTNANILFENVDIDLDSVSSFHQLSGQLSYKNKEFALDSFNIHFPKYNLILIDNSLHARLDGELSNTDSMRINLTSCYLATAGSSIRGMATVCNLNHPSFTIQGTLTVDLFEAKRFIPDSIVKSIKGNLVASINSEGVIEIDSLPEQIPNLIYDHSTFNIDLEDVSLDMPDTLLNVQKLTGRVKITPELITIQNLNGVYSGIDFQLDTTIIRNLYNTVFRGQPGKLHVEGIFRTSDLDYNMLGTFIDADNKDSDSTAGSQDTKADIRKWDYEIKGKLFVNSLKYKNALIDDISTLVNIRDSVYTLDQLKFKAFDGNMNSSVKVSLMPDDRVEIDMKNNVDRMNIRKMLYDLDNFDQTDLTSENISGILSTQELFTRIVMIGDSIVYPDMRMTGDLTLEKGGVFNYEPVQALAPSIPGVKSLDTLEFKTLHSHIFIFKNAIYVPRTYVVSNAFDITAIGMQSFGEDYQYHLEVHLGEILLGKSKKRLRRQDAMGDIITESNRNSIFLKSYSLDGKDGSGLDNKQDRTMMELKVRTQEKMLDLIFHPKLVTFETNVRDYGK